MRHLLRPVTVCVLLLAGVGPTAALACELACVPASAQNHNHDGTHEHGEAGPTSSATGEASLARAGASTCEHDLVRQPAVTAAALKLSAPAEVPVLDAAEPGRSTPGRAAIGTVPGGPPGLRSGPLSLRI